MAFLQHALGSLLVDRPGQARTKDDHLLALRQSGQTMLEVFRTCPQTPRNLATFIRVIGMERWTQTRLKTLLGGPLRVHETDSGYRPSPTTPWFELLTIFEQMRLETQTIARAIPQDLYTRRIPHNTWGQLTVGGWLYFLTENGRRAIARVR